MNQKLLLFDIDATLLRTGGTGMIAMKLVAERLFGSSWEWGSINTGGSLDPVIFAEAAAINRLDQHHSHHERFRDHYIAELEHQITTNMHLFEVLPGVPQLLATLRHRAMTQRDIVLGLLTGNYTGAVPVKFKAAKIEQDWFTVTAFGDEAPTRPDLVVLAMQKYLKQHGRPIDPKRVIVIGDTPRDVHCARAHGCIAFAVATGHYDAKTLREAGADFVVESFVDPAPLLRLID
ncbi:MAG: HAD family hydrolase [Phycisphaeraceae bacterium]